MGWMHDHDETAAYWESRRGNLPSQRIPSAEEIAARAEEVAAKEAAAKVREQEIRAAYDRHLLVQAAQKALKLAQSVEISFTDNGVTPTHKFCVERRKDGRVSQYDRHYFAANEKKAATQKASEYMAEAKENLAMAKAVLAELERSVCT